MVTRLSSGRDHQLLPKLLLIRNTTHPMHPLTMLPTQPLPTLLTMHLLCITRVEVVTITNTINRKDSKEDPLEALNLLLLDTTSNEATMDVLLLTTHHRILLTLRTLILQEDTLDTLQEVTVITTRLMLSTTVATLIPTKMSMVTIIIFFTEARRSIRE